MSKHVHYSHLNQPAPAAATPASASDPLRSMYATSAPHAASSQAAQPSSANSYRQTWQHLHNLPLQINAPFIVSRSNTPTPTFYPTISRWPATAPAFPVHPAFVHPVHAWPAASHGVATVNLAQVHPTDAAYDRSRLLAPLPLRSLSASPSPGLPSSFAGSSHSGGTPSFMFSTPSESNSGQGMYPRTSTSIVAPRRSKRVRERTNEGASDEPGSDDSDEIFGSDPPSSDARQSEDVMHNINTRRVTRSSLSKPENMAVSTLLDHPSSDDFDSQSTPAPRSSSAPRSSISKAVASVQQATSSPQASSTKSLFPLGRAMLKLDELESVSPPTPRSRDGRHPFKPRHQVIRNAADLYTPRWARGGRTGEGAKADIGSKEGWCSLCVLEGAEGTWHNLRNSSYRYHMVRMHGVSSKTCTFVAEPLRIARTKKAAEKKLHGECHECSKTVFFSAEYPPTAWFVHAAGCHAVVKEVAEGSEADTAKDAPAVTTRQRAAPVVEKELPTTKRKAGTSRFAKDATNKLTSTVASKVPVASGSASNKRRRGTLTPLTSSRPSSPFSAHQPVSIKKQAGTTSRSSRRSANNIKASSSTSRVTHESDEETDIETDVEMAQLLLSFSAPSSSATLAASAALGLSVPHGFNAAMLHAHGPRRSAFNTSIVIISPQRSPRTARSDKAPSSDGDKENLPPPRT